MFPQASEQSKDKQIRLQMSLLIRTLILLAQNPTPMTSFTPNYLLTPNTVVRGLGLQCKNFEGHILSVHR